MATPVIHKRLPPSRESLASVSDDGSRVSIQPADVRGRFTLGRRVAAVALIAVYILLPWIPINGAPAVFIDVGSLRFHFFGLTLAAQDFWLLFFLLTGMAFSLFYVTALFGRLWCGWACPQTVFLEHVYRRIERLLEGDGPERRRLDQAPWTAEKFIRRGLKHVLFVLVSLLIAHVLLAYFVSLPHVWQMITHAPGEHWGVFLFIVVTTGILYFNFAWFREQLCIIVCPYGRLQSALIDDHSVTIGYDSKRGEPRGKLHHGGPEAAEAATLGDCIDCHRCVHVCPTGIDIRQGLQLECIACANCIDACDEVMTRVGRPKGLIRYDSLQGFNGGRAKLLRPRTVLYTILLLIGAGVATFSATRYQPASMTALRMTGAPYYVDENTVRNQFMVRIINKSTAAADFVLALVPGTGAPEGITAGGWDEPVTVEPGAELVRPLVVFVPRGVYAGRFQLAAQVSSVDGDIVMQRELEFVGPDPRLFKAR